MGRFRVLVGTKLNMSQQLVLDAEKDNSIQGYMLPAG